MTEISNTEKINENVGIIHPGEMLRVARENKGITKKQVSAALNLPERFIDYLEAGDFAKLPGHTFARGYIRNYAKFLELQNAEELVNIFDSYTGTNALGSSVNNLRQIKQIKQISNNIYWLVSFIVVLVVIGIIFIWWQGRNSANNVNTVDNTPIVVEPTTTNLANEQMTTPATELNTQHDTVNVSVAEPTIPAATPDERINARDNGVNVNSEMLPSVTSNSEPTPVPAPIDPNEGIVQAKFSGNCWITINDATGKVLVSKLMTKGSDLEVKGKPPLDVMLGAPNTVTMTYNGQAVTINAKPGATHRLKLGQ